MGEPQQRRWRVWLDERTGIVGLLRDFLAKPMPAHVGWPHVLGSGLLFLLVMQIVTGAAMALYFAPTPDHARDSLVFLESQRFGGLVHGMHTWAASLIMVLIALHLVRVFTSGAFRRPREVTWWSGVGLLLLLPAFAFTGYLLPWDQQAYWATVVGTEVMGTAPVVGAALERFVRGGDAVGALTLNRFFAVHVILLPLALGCVLGLHLWLVRRHGPAPPPSGARAAPPVPFFPRQVFRDTVWVFVLCLALIALAVAVPPEIGAPADPADVLTTPRPEWYFLFLFQLLKLFQGRLEVVGTMLLPGAFVLALVLLPWLERRRSGGTGRRAALAGAALVVVGGLTLFGWRDRPATPPGAGGASGGPTPHALAGLSLARELGCLACHPLAGADAANAGGGRPLLGHAATRDAAWRRTHYLEPRAAARPGGPAAPPAGGPPPAVEELKMLEAFVEALAVPAPAVLAATPVAVHGGRLFFDYLCIECHTINGRGGSKGPDLTGVAARRPREWMRAQILEPRSHNPESKMPTYAGKMTAGDLEGVLAYLATLR